MSVSRPVIGITADIHADRYRVHTAYAELIARTGGLPFILPCRTDCLHHYLDLCHAFLFTGGDDPDTSHWAVPPHPRAKLISPQRQRFELALLDALDRRPERPVLAVCLGMQMMALHAGGMIHQFLPDILPSASDHYGPKHHEITGELGRGLVHSHHRQAVSDPGSLRVVALAHDGLIEALAAPDRPFYLGVQWHPERTPHEPLGLDLFRRLVDAAATRP